VTTQRGKTPKTELETSSGGGARKQMTSTLAGKTRKDGTPNPREKSRLKIEESQWEAHACNPSYSGRSQFKASLGK
jgi:hypothetical protein